MTRINTLLFALFALVMLAALAPATAHAQTPDGVTPSIEEACDFEIGAAFGLCNAYCEAMDCHLGNDLDESTSPSASAMACTKVQYRFFQITERNVPCDDIVCPPGSEGCPCDGFSCDGELYCDEEQLVCTGSAGDVS